MKTGQIPINKLEADILRYIWVRRNRTIREVEKKFDLTHGACNFLIDKLVEGRWLQRSTIRLTGGLLHGTQKHVILPVGRSRNISKLEQATLKDKTLKEIFSINNDAWFRTYFKPERADEILDSVKALEMREEEDEIRSSKANHQPAS